MEINVDDLLEKGFDIMHINQILLSDPEAADFLKILNTDTPLEVFREIRNNFHRYSRIELDEILKKYCGTHIELSKGSIFKMPVLGTGGLILGASGTGKSFSAKLHLLRALQEEGNIIVTDPKGELAENISDLFERKTIVSE